MKKKNKIAIFVVVFLLLAGFAAYIFFNPQKALNIIVPEFENIENIYIRLGRDTAFVNVAISLENKSLFRLHIDSMIYYVNFDSATMLAKRQYLDLDILRGQSDTFQLPLALPYKRLIKKIRSIQDRDSVDLRMDLRVVFSTVFGHTAIPLSKKIRIAVPRPPKLEFDRMEFLKREKKKVYLLAHVKLHNYGKIDLNISDISYKLTVTDLLSASGTEKKEIRVKPATTIPLTIPVQLELKNVIKTLRLVITDKDKVKYHLLVKALVQNDKVGSKKTPLELETDGTLELKK